MASTLRRSHFCSATGPQPVVQEICIGLWPVQLLAFSQYYQKYVLAYGQYTNIFSFCSSTGHQPVLGLWLLQQLDVISATGPQPVVQGRYVLACGQYMAFNQYQKYVLAYDQYSKKMSFLQCYWPLASCTCFSHYSGGPPTGGAPVWFTLSFCPPLDCTRRRRRPH